MQRVFYLDEFNFVREVGGVNADRSKQLARLLDKEGWKIIHISSQYERTVMVIEKDEEQVTDNGQ